MLADVCQVFISWRFSAESALSDVKQPHSTRELFSAPVPVYREQTESYCEPADSPVSLRTFRLAPGNLLWCSKKENILHITVPCMKVYS